MLDASNVQDLVDPCLGGNYDPQQMNCVVLTASLCVEPSPILRPRMSQAHTQPPNFHIFTYISLVHRRLIMFLCDNVCVLLTTGCNAAKR